jgi:Secretion system C-terminal sorting domain
MTGGTDINFSVANVTGSNAVNRFMIVFEPLKALPITFTSVKAYLQGGNIGVEWRVQNERNMQQYKVEKSTDGIQFSAIAVKPPVANNGSSAIYEIQDANPLEGYNYYRIHGVDINGKGAYSNVVKVMVNNIRPGIMIYPNPITDGIIHLQFVNMPEGKYKIRLLDKLGQLIVQRQITHAGGNATELIKWDYNLAHGIYQLEVTQPDGSIKDLNVMY